MSEAEHLNRILERDAPAVYRCLSPLGRQAVFPKDIPFQSAAASHTRINATIGQMTDGFGKATPLSVMEDLVPGLDPAMMFLYAPVEGHKNVREAWRARESRLGGSSVKVALPCATHGLSHGLSLLANLFGDPDTTLLVPSPFWGNYKLIFGMHTQMKVATFPFFKDGTFNLQGLEDALKAIPGKTIALLNLPGNPTGYALTPKEAKELTGVFARHPRPVVTIVDDAYQGFIYEEDRQVRSEFWDLAEALDPERHALFKVDGATKELLFFSSRLGFITHPFVQGQAEEAILSKLKYLIRGTVGCPAGPSQAMVLKTLEHPGIERAFQDRFEIMRRRYRALKAAVAEIDSPRMIAQPFNAAFFMLFDLHGVNADDVRKRLIDEESVGTISFNASNALRLAFCSVDENDIPELVRKVVKVVESA